MGNEEDDWPYHCWICGSRMVVVTDLWELGGVLICSNKECENSIYKDAERQVPGTAIAQRYEALDLDKAQEKIERAVEE